VSKYKNKVALVTGGGTGIGRATALEFAIQGAKVIIADINDKESTKTLAMINEAGGEAFFVHADVSQEDDAKAMVDEGVAQFGQLDFACNNAGIEGVSASIAEMTVADWNKVIGVNLSGVFLSMKYEIPEILKAGGGAIVNVASILGQVGFANASAYTAAKHGVLGLSKTGALEYSSQGIRVNAVCPAFIVTPMLERAGITSNKDMREAMEAMHPIGRLGEPEEVAKVVTWLCSDEASFISGEALLVDGGYVAQ
jgi:NAD(P)-dependent dehydrogenase (short-subunit alcohol dehydrogenase family)